MFATLFWLSGWITAVITLCFYKNRQWRARERKRNDWWRGRLDGWQACERMVLQRAEEEEGYTRDKVWKDLVQ